MELFVPLQKYLPGHHIPDMSAHGCKDIKELLVQTKHSATIGNEDVLDLAFVLDPGLIAKKANIVLLGMESIYEAKGGGRLQGNAWYCTSLEKYIQAIWTFQYLKNSA